MTTKGIVAAILSIAILHTVNATTYTAATVAEIFINIPKLTAGDSLVLTAANYVFAKEQKIVLPQSGQKGKRIFFGIRGNTNAKLDFSAHDYVGTNQGIKINGNYWYMRGLDIFGAGDNGMLIENSTIIGATWNDNRSSGCYNIIEKCNFIENSDSGLNLKNGATFDTIINCDSYLNFDSPAGGNADGFAPKQNCGTGIYFYGCRSWHNSDDGWDAFFKGTLQASTRSVITCEYCITFYNGTIKDGTQPSGSNGNGFKMGSKEFPNDFVTKHCLAVSNHGKSGSKGFDANNNTGTMTMLNCSAYNNFAYEFSMQTGTSIIKNCNAIGGASDIKINSTPVTSDWTAVAADFESLDTNGLMAPRNSDGSLPLATLKFMKPKSGDTKFVDKGTDVGLPVSGAKADIGWNEVGLNISAVKDVDVSRPSSSAGELVTTVSTTQKGVLKLDLTVLPSGTLNGAIYDVTGKKVITIKNSFSAGNKSQLINIMGLAAGIYM